MYLAQLKGLGKKEAKERLRNIGLRNLIFTLGGIRKFKNYLRGWLKKYSLLLP